jgi:hypothetical protein
MISGTPIRKSTAVAVITVDTAPGVSQTFYYATRSVRVTISPGVDVHAQPRLKRVPTLTQTAADESSLAGFKVPSYGQLDLANTDGALDAFDQYLWPLGAMILVHVLTGTAAAGETVSISGRTPEIVALAQEARPGDTVTIALRDKRAAILQATMTRTTYRGMQHALRFDGSNDYASTGATDLTVASGNTIECWLRQNALPGADAFVWAWGDAAWTGAAVIEARLQILNGTKTLRLKTARFSADVSVDKTHSFPLGDPFHVACTWDATAAKLYINGELVGTGAGTAYTAGAEPLWISKNPSAASGYAPITIDDVRRWSCVRTQAQIRESMRARLIGNEANLANWWALQDGAGTATAVDSVTATGATAADMALGAAGACPTWVSACEGTADMSGQPKRRLLGMGQNVRCVPVDPLRLVYQIADGPLGDLGVAAGSEFYFDVRDKGSSYTRGANYDALDDFISNTPAAGSFSSCLRHGLVKVASATGEVTCDCYGEVLHTLRLSAINAPSNIYAIRFDGTNDHGTVPAGWSTLASDFSFGCWFRTSHTSTGTQNIVSNKSGSSAGRRCLQLNASVAGQWRISASVYNDAGTQCVASSAINAVHPNRWYWAFTAWDASALTLTLYLNGVLVGAATGSGSYTTAEDATTYIAQSGTGSSYFAGDIAWITESWARSNWPINPFWNGIIPSGSPVYAVWPMREGAGTTVAETYAYATITLVNGPTWVPGPSPDCPAAWLEFFLSGNFYVDLGGGPLLYGQDEIEPTYLSLPPFQLGWIDEGEKPTLQDLIDPFLRTFGAALVPVNDASYGNVYRIVRIHRPAFELAAGGVTEAASTAADIAVYPGQVARVDPLSALPPASRILVGYGRIAYPQDAGSLATTVSATNRALWAKAISWTEKTISAMAGYSAPPAPEISIETLLVCRADAAAMLEQFALLYGKVRRYYTLDLRGVDALAPANCPNLAASGYTRQGIASEPRFRALSVARDFERNAQTVVGLRAT